RVARRTARRVPGRRPDGSVRRRAVFVRAHRRRRPDRVGRTSPRRAAARRGGVAREVLRVGSPPMTRRRWAAVGVVVAFAAVVAWILVPPSERPFFDYLAERRAAGL